MPNIKPWLAVVVLIIGIGVAVAAFQWISDRVAVDRCLDAGSRWNAATERCEDARPGG